jgi:peptidoglycan-associated lipoprotein
MFKKWNWAVLFILCFFLAMGAGCAKKATVSHDVMTQPGSSAADQKSKDEMAAKLAQEEKARQQALRDKAAQDEEAMKKKAQSTGDRNVQAEAPGLVDIHFDFDKYAIRAQDREVLSKDAAWIKKNNPNAVTIEGNCDERGTAEYNLALGERRALETKKYLVTLGIEEKILKTISYGNERPLDPGHNEGAWAQNRRAHFVAGSK